MTTNSIPHYTASTRRRRLMAATMLGAAGAMTVGGLGSAAPAHAGGDSYVFLAYSLVNKASGVGYGTGSESAAQDALEKCNSQGCTVYASADNGCAAMAVSNPNVYGGYDKWSSATAPLLHTAQTNALHNNGGGIIAVSGCSSDGNNPPVNNPGTNPGDNKPPVINPCGRAVRCP